MGACHDQPRSYGLDLQQLHAGVGFQQASFDRQGFLLNDRIIDVMPSATNVTGQMLVPVLVAKEEGLLNEDFYNDHVAGLPGDRTPRRPTPFSVVGYLTRPHKARFAKRSPV